MIRKYTWSGFLVLTLFSLFFATGCSETEEMTTPTSTGDDALHSDRPYGEGTFEVTFFADGSSDMPQDTRAAISGASDRVQSLIYLLYRKNANGQYAYVKKETVFRPENYNVAEEHDWPLPAIRETLQNGDYRVVFLGNLDNNLFAGQQSEHVLQNYMTYYDDARIVMPIAGPLAFTDQNMYYFASAEFNPDTPQVEILLQRVVTKHQFLREFVNPHDALNQLADNITRNIKKQQLTTSIADSLLHSALLEPIGNIPLISLTSHLTTQIVDALAGALAGNLVDALNDAVLQVVLIRLNNTLVANNSDTSLLGLGNLLNPWTVSSGADVTGAFVPSIDFHLQPSPTSDQASVTWENIPMQKQQDPTSNEACFISMVLLGGDNKITSIDIKKEGLVGPLVDGVVDDAVLYGRLINIKNPLAYTSSPNVAYNTHYAFLNLTLDDYGTSDASDPVTVEAKLDPTLMTSDLLSNLLGDLLGGDLLGLLLSPLLETVTEVLRTTTFVLDIKLPDLGIHNIVIEGGWDPTTSSID